MKQVALKIGILVGLILLITACREDWLWPSACQAPFCMSEEDFQGTVTDPDGNIYRWKVMADGKKWLVENLRYDVPYSKLYQKEDYPEDIEYNPELYGRLYDWAEAMTACEALGDGWRLPTGYDLKNQTPGDWDGLAEAYGGWDSEHEYEAYSSSVYTALMQGGSSGFDAVLGGTEDPRDPFDPFHSLGRVGIYWSATRFNTYEAGYYRFVDYGDFGDFGDGIFDRTLPLDGPTVSHGFSCRCVHD